LFLCPLQEIILVLLLILMAKYPYTVLPGEITPVYKPLIPVLLNCKKTHKITPPINALVDSGADVCFCAKNIGLWLGIQFKKKRPYTFTTANKTPFQAMKEEVILYTAGTRLTCPFFFTDTLPKETPVILGQQGFFENFRITFDVRSKIIEIL